MSKVSTAETVQITCLREVVKGGSRTFPLYIGFASAAELVRVAAAPAFKATDAQRTVADRVLDPPVSDWQRPLDELRVEEISRVFDNVENLMPNPVLLSANVDVDSVVPKPIVGAGGTPTGAYEVRLTVPNDGAKSAAPLWILDGQHRINGLAKSGQRHSKIPVVLLLDAGVANSYTGRDFASIFAQVTVTAKSLEPIHQEWLTYCYELGAYATELDNHELHHDAFETVALLCSEPAFGVGDSSTTNPFFNAIRFNPEDGSPRTTRSGFNYDCPELKSLLLRHYFQPAETLGKDFDPAEVAAELAKALAALEEVVAEPQADSVFFGKQNRGHKVMQDAFLAGACSRLVVGGPPPSWTQLLTDLKFTETNWNFAWASTRGGNAGNVSRKLAEAVMSRALREGSLPASGNLADYLRGNKAEVILVASPMKPSGGSSPLGKKEISVVRGDDLSENIGNCRHVKILQPGRKGPTTRSTSENVGKIVVYDANKSGPPLQIKEITGSGLDLTSWQGTSIKLSIVLEHYGDKKSEAILELNWS